MANLPEQIRKQVEAAQSLMDGQRKSQSQDGDTAVLESPTEVPATPPNQPAAAVTPPEAPRVVEDENSPTYAQRWRSLDGTLRAERSRNDALQQQINMLQQQLSAMQTAPVERVAQQQNHLTDQDSKEFGDDMVDFVRRGAREELRDVAGAVLHLKQSVDEVRNLVPQVQQLSSETAKTAQDRFFTQLQGLVADYKAVNADQRFHDWLLSPDPMTGMLRQTYLADAQRVGDVERVASIFNTWKSLSGTSTPTRDTRRAELERQIAPSRNIASAPVEDKGRTWTPQDVTKLYDDHRKGLYRGKEAEFKALEADIFKAQADGRFRR